VPPDSLFSASPGNLVNPLIFQKNMLSAVDAQQLLQALQGR